MTRLVFETEVTVDHRLRITLPDELPAGCKVKVTVEPAIEDDILQHYQPRTELGWKMLAARRAYLEGGGKLMDWDEISA